MAAYTLNKSDTLEQWRNNFNALATSIGDVASKISGPSSSVNGQLVIFSGVAGNAAIAATSSGILIATNGVLGTATAGTDIKTINSISIIGAGDIVVQSPLVSGTNIKTINNSSILGAGNLVVGVIAWSIKTANYTAVANDAVMANTAAGTFTVTLPAAPAANDTVRIADYAGTFGTHNLTVGRNGSNIMGIAQDMILNISNVSITLTYIDVTQGWRLV